MCVGPVESGRYYFLGVLHHPLALTIFLTFWLSEYLLFFCFALLLMGRGGKERKGRGRGMGKERKGREKEHEVEWLDGGVDLGRVGDG